ncbi:M6 family metalloprotease domain-containing protein [Flavobacteriaceae bacterium TP-CH-4]|uniref:M6 family metalloprotease domain-containing protein n=1 Tax=Pelagihabitans pacificus TaxID=2696054 RepID=A0A967ARE8_9FLAO|nr:M6 family metalloprotease domain-containing protein [Pelagihabitans pacificus]NHF58115.1 M6 family metalloprotease domain-containing protein [Pelagihabitans pacificus]
MATPFFNEKFTFTNPDGSTFEVVGSGNQFYAHFETEDGYTVVKDPDTGYYKYAQLSDDQHQLIPTAKTVGEVDPKSLGLQKHLKVKKEDAKRMAESSSMAQGPQPRWKTRRAERKAALAQQRAALGPQAAAVAAPTVGNYVGLCILIEFPDVPQTISRQEVTNFCNQTGYSGFGNNGSVKDYFFDNSKGKLTYTNVVTEYYTAQHNRSYYTDPSVSFGSRARELITEALDHLVAQGFNFSQLTADGSNFIYALNVFYAGPRVNNWSEGLWPHQWVLSSPYNVAGGKKFNDYQITNMGSSLTLRTFCHENGHMICNFADLYDYGGESAGVGHFCLMCYGGNNTNPVQIGAYMKNEAGWASSLNTISPGVTATLDAAKNDFYIHSKNADEYFIVENRQKTGRDTHLPDAGLAIWHVDEQGSNSNEQMTAAQHYECSIEQADNNFDLEGNANAGDANDLFSAPGNTEFSDTTSPNSKWWDGSNSDLKITNISNSGPVMTFQAQGVAGWVYGKDVRYVSGDAHTKWAHAIIQDFSGWRRIAPTSTDGITNVLTILKTAAAKNKKVNVNFGADGMIYGVYMS